VGALGVVLVTTIGEILLFGKNYHKLILDLKSSIFLMRCSKPTKNSTHGLLFSIFLLTGVFQNGIGSQCRCFFANFVRSQPVKCTLMQRKAKLCALRKLKKIFLPKKEH
jgi:hypothetical protein